MTRMLFWDILLLPTMAKMIFFGIFLLLNSRGPRTVIVPDYPDDGIQKYQKKHGIVNFRFLAKSR